MDTQLPEFFPLLSIIPPLSMTGVECPPLYILYQFRTHKKKVDKYPPRSAPFRGFPSILQTPNAPLRFAKVRQCKMLYNPLHYAPLRSAPLQKVLRYATLPFALRSAPLAPLRSARSPRKAALPASLRSALLYIKGRYYVQNGE